MGVDNVHSQGLNLVLSTDAKPRLKWTPELHTRFVDTVIELGGAEKVTPKSVMKAMGIPGLSLYHFKSHLQKYRVEINQQTKNCIDERKHSLGFILERTEEQTSNPVYKSWQITHVQRELHEQMEVQKHLQIRIEGQGKYLQKVLKKAQEALATYTCTSMGDSGYSSPLFSDLTEDTRPSIVGNGSSTESSLTSYETSVTKKDVELKILEDDQPWKIHHSSDPCRKRKGSPTTDNREACKKLPT